MPHKKCCKPAPDDLLLDDHTTISLPGIYVRIFPSKGCLLWKRPFAKLHWKAFISSSIPCKAVAKAVVVCHSATNEHDMTLTPVMLQVCFQLWIMMSESQWWHTARKSIWYRRFHILQGLFEDSCPFCWGVFTGSFELSTKLMHMALVSPLSAEAPFEYAMLFKYFVWAQCNANHTDSSGGPGDPEEHR